MQALKLMGKRIEVGNFLQGKNFRDFYDQTPACENFLREFFLQKILADDKLRKPSIVIEQMMCIKA